MRESVWKREHSNTNARIQEIDKGVEEPGFLHLHLPGFVRIARDKRHSFLILGEVIVVVIDRGGEIVLKSKVRVR